MLVEFASAVDAVCCSAEIQREMAEQHADLPQDQRIEFRIGIHVGDIIIDDNDIFGDGVNIAARLEGIAEAGGVCISDDAYRQVRGKVGLAYDDLGPQTLKNIVEPMRVWRIKVVGQGTVTEQSGSPAGQAPALALPDKPSIAVLPFQNMSGDPDQEYFADGMVEDIITALSRKRLLFVIARNSSFTYKGRAVSIQQVGRELGVRYVLEGSVRRSGGRVRITGQLIDATTGAHLWADRFDGGVEDVFDLQDRVSASVVGAILPQLDRAEIDRSSRKPTANLAAYDYYLRGAASNTQFTREGSDAAFPHFQKAVELDPNFAIAHAAVAQWFAQRRTWGWGGDPASDAIKATGFAKRALHLGRDDAVVLAYAAWAFAICALDVEAATGHLEESIRLDPNLFIGWTYLGWMKVYQGEHDAAIESLHRAVRLSPLDPRLFVAQNGLAYACFFLDRHSEAATWANASLRNRPGYITSLRVAIASRALGGREEEARELWASMKALFPNERVSETRKRSPNLRAQDVAKLVLAFRKAGMPE